MTEPKAARNYALDFLKVVATTVIVFHHYQWYSGLRFANYLDFSSNPYFDWTLMVELFFTISGFFAYRVGGAVRENGSFGAYIGPKLLRLLPVMAVSCFVCFAVDVLHVKLYGVSFAGKAVPELSNTIIASLGLYMGLGPAGYEVNDPVWFVSALLLCYAGYYLLSLLARRFKWRMQWVLAAVLIVVYGLFQVEAKVQFLSWFALRGYLSFTIGLLVGWLLTRCRVTRILQAGCAACILLFLAFVAFARAYINPSTYFTFLVCPSLVILSQGAAAAKCFRHAIWQRLSEISYNVYVWHFGLQMLMNIVAYDFMHAPTPVNMYLFTAMTWAFGTVSYFVIERPLRKWLPTLWTRAFAAPEAS